MSTTEVKPESKFTQILQAKAKTSIEPRNEINSATEVVPVKGAVLMSPMARAQQKHGQTTIGATTENIEENQDEDKQDDPQNAMAVSYQEVPIALLS